MILLVMAIGWMAGIVLASVAPQVQPGWPWLAGAGLLLAILMRRDVRLRTVSLCLLTCGLGMGRYAAMQIVIDENQVSYYNDHGFTELTGVVDAPPNVTDSAIQLRVKVQRIRQGDVQRAVEGDALVYADRLGSYQYGDLVRVGGIAQTPPEFDTFSWRDYLVRQGLRTIMLRANVTVVDHDQGSPVLATLYKLNGQARQLIDKLLPSPGSGFLAGILLGDDSGLSPDVRDAFRRTGTSHLIAISGSNITIVIGLVTALLSRIKNKRITLTVTVATIALYTVFVGASPSVVRAAIMGSLALIALQVGRRAEGITSLAATIWVITVFNPNLLFDAGLLLSSAATLGLIVYLRPITAATEHYLGHVFKSETASAVASVLADTVLITLAAQLSTLPLSFALFGEFSLASVFVNVLVVPVQSIIMTLGILAVLVGALVFPVGQIIAWIAALPLNYSLAIIRAAAEIPGVSVPVVLSLPAMVGFYVALAAVTLLLMLPKAQRAVWLSRLRQQITTPLIVIVGGSLAALVWITVLTRPDGNLHVHFLAVSEGDAVLIQTPNGAAILIDGGDNPTRLATALGDRMPFYRRDIDALIITQWRRATMAAAATLFDNFGVHSVLTTGHMPDEDVYKAFVAAVASHGVTQAIVTAGYTLTTDDGLTIEVIAPDAVPSAEAKPTDVPMVLRVRYGMASFLIMSEVSEKDMTALAKMAKELRSTVLLLPSNGSAKVNTPAWIAATAPQAAVIVAEAGNTAAMPDAVVTEDYLLDVPTFRTDVNGNIEIVTDGATLWINRARP